jgi:hypothetical protein
VRVGRDPGVLSSDMDPIIWIIAAVIGLLGFGTAEADVDDFRLGPPPWVTGDNPSR